MTLMCMYIICIHRHCYRVGAVPMTICAVGVSGKSSMSWWRDLGDMGELRKYTSYPASHVMIPVVPTIAL